MKNKLRRYALEKRKKINIELNSTLILKKLFNMEEYKKSKNILCYYPLKYEVNTAACLNDKSKNLFLPRVNGVNLDICPYKEDKIKVGSYNIYEPQTDKISFSGIIDMVIIPAAAADRNGFRAGYGKGYYDRFLHLLNHSPVKVILIFSELLFDDIHPDEYDEKADIIITEREILNIGNYMRQ